MIDVVVFFIAFLFLQKILIDIPAKKRIKNSTKADVSIVIRNMVRSKRKLFLRISLLGFYVYSTALCFTGSDELSSILFICIKIIIVNTFVSLWYYLIKKRAMHYLGNISTFSKETFLSEHSRFSLYLRGFEDDKYSHGHRFSKKDFSEYQFVRILKTRIHVCAVGMTKELDSPEGATRVYVNDSTWKDDVRELMEKAESIYVLVNDRPSCLWEIEQTSEFKNKTVYLVNDIDKYKNVQLKLSKTIDLPDSPYKSDKRINFSVSFVDDEYKICCFENTFDGYASIAKGNARMIAYQDALQKRIFWGWAMIYVLPILLILPMIIPSVVLQSSHTHLLLSFTWILGTFIVLSYFAWKIIRQKYDNLSKRWIMY